MVVAVAAVAVAGGTAAAIAAAAGSSLSPSSFFADVAKHLGISTEKLQDATKAAAIDQVDAALKAGRITQAQADELKSRIESGDVPPFFGPAPFGERRLDGHGPLFGFGAAPERVGGALSSAASYLGLTADQLFQKLRAGQSLADVAKAQGKSVDALEQAIFAGAKMRLDELVASGSLTSAQETAMLGELKSRVSELVDGTFPNHRFGHPGFPRFRPPSAPRSTGGTPPPPAVDL